MSDFFRELAKFLFGHNPGPDIDLPPGHPILRAQALLKARTIDYGALAVAGQEAVELLRADPNDARDGALALATIAENLAKKDVHKEVATAMAVDALCHAADIEKPIPARVLANILETMPVGAARTELAIVLADQIVALEETRRKPTNLMRRTLALMQEELTVADTTPERRYALHAFVAQHASNPIQIKEAADGVMEYSRYAPSHAVRIETLGILHKKSEKYPLLNARIGQALDNAIRGSRPIREVSVRMLGHLDA